MTKTNGNSRDEIRRLVEHLLTRCVLSTFEYWSEFNIRVEIATDARKDLGGSSKIPAAMHLRLRSDWYFDDPTEWRQELARFPLKGGARVSESDPMRAGLVTAYLGTEVASCHLRTDGSMVLEIAGIGRRIVIPGASDAWEESWILEEPGDITDPEKWIFQCSSTADLSGRWRW